VAQSPVVEANSPRILIVEDERGILDLIEDLLRLENFESSKATDGMDALALLRREKFDLAIVDINLPRLTGLELIEKLRSEGNETPFLFLTARREREDIAAGLRLGADDYLTKPFGVEELILRVRAILRRTSPVANKGILIVGPISMNISAHEVRLDGEVVELSPTEFKLLRYLMENSGQVISKETILRNIWEFDFESNSTVVDTYISYLRKKLHKNGFSGIKTIRGVGFEFLES
jgi:two-component system, OmpR family, response regulator